MKSAPLCLDELNPCPDKTIGEATTLMESRCAGDLGVVHDHGNTRVPISI